MGCNIFSLLHFRNFNHKVHNVSRPANRNLGGAANINHNLILMIHMVPKSPQGAGNDMTLQGLYTAVLDRVMGSNNMPLGTPAQLAAQAVNSWQWASTCIAFPLLGCKDNYGYQNTAQQALGAIQGWFDDPVLGATRRAQITRIDLVVPPGRPDTGKIRNAWEMAWG